MAFVWCEKNIVFHQRRNNFVVFFYSDSRHDNQRDGVLQSQTKLNIRIESNYGEKMHKRKSINNTGSKNNSNSNSNSNSNNSNLNNKYEINNHCDFNHKNNNCMNGLNRHSSHNSYNNRKRRNDHENYNNVNGKRNIISNHNNRRGYSNNSHHSHAHTHSHSHSHVSHNSLNPTKTSYISNNNNKNHFDNNCNNYKNTSMNHQTTNRVNMNLPFPANQRPQMNTTSINGGGYIGHNSQQAPHTTHTIQYHRLQSQRQQHQQQQHPQPTSMGPSSIATAVSRSTISGMPQISRVSGVSVPQPSIPIQAPINSGGRMSMNMNDKSSVVGMESKKKEISDGNSQSDKSCNKANIGAIVPYTPSPSRSVSHSTSPPKLNEKTNVNINDNNGNIGIINHISNEDSYRSEGEISESVASEDRLIEKINDKPTINTKLIRKDENDEKVQENYISINETQNTTMKNSMNENAVANNVNKNNNNNNNKIQKIAFNFKQKDKNKSVKKALNSRMQFMSPGKSNDNENENDDDNNNDDNDDDKCNGDNNDINFPTKRLNSNANEENRDKKDKDNNMNHKQGPPLLTAQVRLPAPMCSSNSNEVIERQAQISRQLNNKPSEEEVKQMLNNVTNHAEKVLSKEKCTNVNMNSNTNNNDNLTKKKEVTVEHRLNSESSSITDFSAGQVKLIFWYINIGVFLVFIWMLCLMIWCLNVV